ncbi:MAG TPA: hypothetical protein VG916_04450 [Gemmatimonadaceae bacterium]|nr:hypothetical protein [Gemmatimonadaceae bacterium]
MPRRKSTPPAAPPAADDRISYRELRNTPGRVWERLAADEPLTLVADGEARAVVIPVHGGDARGALEAYRRGRAMMALRRLRESARSGGQAALTLTGINAVVSQVRRERRTAERSRER